LAAAELAPEKAERLLASLLSADSDASVRTAAAAALGILGGERIPPELHAAVLDADVRVRRAAVKALGSFDDPAAIDRLLETVDDDDRETSIRAAEALNVLTDAPTAGATAAAGARDSGAWSVAYARALAEVTG
jgi:HEAT repeat protein